MGVPGFYKWLSDNKEKFKCKNVVVNEIANKPEIIDYFMIDGNGSFHMCLKFNIDEFKNGNKNNIKNINNPREEIIQKTINSFINLIDYMIEVLNCKNVFIAIDGVAPIGKVIQQRQRRYKYLFDSQFKNEIAEISSIETTLINDIDEPNIPVRSIELTPGTNIMEIIHKAITKYVNKYSSKVNIMYSSYHSEGEGEHKILQFIKKYISSDKTIVIYGLDADLMFLSLSVGRDYDMYIMRETQIFNGKEVDLKDTLTYNYIDVCKLHDLIENIGISTYDFILICFLIGNDFLPRLATIDVKKHGLDKLIETFLRAFEKNDKSKPILVKEYLKDNKKRVGVNHKSFLHYLRRLTWTERYVWQNMNKTKRDNVDYNKMMNNFIDGKNENIEFIDKKEFNSRDEYYNYYLGINSFNTNEENIQKMVNNYITGIEWCLQYYLYKCVSWSWGYNFLIAPLINDIVNFYPQQIIIKKEGRVLKPVEQLLIAIPPDTYKFVVEKSIIEDFKNNLEIGYMMPDKFDIDVNKETLYWKCSVKIPPVECYDYVRNIHKLNISNNKNTIENFLIINNKQKNNKTNKTNNTNKTK
jgi:5'-3' exonuclease